MRLTETFHDWLLSTIDEAGVSIPHGLVLGDDDNLTVVALAVPIDQAYAFMLTEWALNRPKEIIFAIDRFTKPGQGTTLGDLVAGHHFVRDQSSRPFIVEYRHDPRIVQPIDWGNLFWNSALTLELRGAIRLLGMPK
ncbi:hypothetical protein [Sphingomonas sp. PAMC 26605]|uniref:hypothetical protein n=1 Tax=Sphingomonas sp. PAMC 26605 TaxID=1112214 RepID=UPI00026CAC33|nr:hypothetical protein [Sphingomonas sp. PAMC 26605]